MGLFPIKIEQVFRVFKIFGYFTSAWPAEVTAGKGEIFLRELGWILAILNILGSMTPLVLSAWYIEYDIVRMMRALSEFMAMMEVLFNLILCKIARRQLQKLTESLQNFVKHSELQERQVIQKYINRYSKFSVFVIVVFICTAMAFSCGPLILSMDTPIDGWYPFPTDNPYVRGVLYILQVITILQCGVGVSVDLTIAMFFWFSSARLEILGLELQQITNESEVKTCIRKHHEIISFVGEVQNAVQYLICKSIFTMSSSVIFGTVPLMYNPPATVIIQFVSIIMASCERIYITAWPADDLAEISQEIAWFAYNMPWFQKSHRTATSVLILVQRSKKPLLISMGSMFPALSLQYYVNFLKTILSYFMTMRTMVGM